MTEKKQKKNIDAIAYDDGGYVSTPAPAPAPASAPALPKKNSKVSAVTLDSNGNTVTTPIYPSVTASLNGGLEPVPDAGNVKGDVPSADEEPIKLYMNIANKAIAPPTIEAEEEPVHLSMTWTNSNSDVPTLKSSSETTSQIAPYPEFDTSAWVEATNRIQSELDALKSGRTSYTDQMLDAMNAYRNRDAFSYDPNSDPLFQSALASAMNSGKQAMQDTMGQAAGLTGGYGSSFATSAANQAYNSFVEGAYDNIADYYNMALNQYNMEGQQLLNTYDMLAQQDASEWNRAYSSLQSDIDLYNSNYTNSLNAYNANRNNYYDAAGINEDIREFNLGFDEGVREFDLGYNEGVREFDLGYNEGVREFDLGYNEGVREFDIGTDLEREKMKQNKEQNENSLEWEKEKFGRQEAQSESDRALEEREYLAQYGATTWDELKSMIKSGELVSYGGKLITADEASSKATGTVVTDAQLKTIIEDSVKAVNENGSFDAVLDSSPYAKYLTDDQLLELNSSVMERANLPYSMREYDVSIDNKKMTMNQLKTNDFEGDFESNISVTTYEKIDGKNKKVKMTLAQLKDKFIQAETDMNITPITAEEDWNDFKANLIASLLKSGAVLKGWTYSGKVNQSANPSIPTSTFDNPYNWAH